MLFRKKPYRLVLILLLVVGLTATGFKAAHKFYVSVTEVNYANDQQSLQLTTRLFVDDFQRLLQERYDKNAMLIRGNENPKVEGYIVTYFEDKLQVKVDGKQQKLQFIGKRYEDDLVICYFEITDVNPFTRIQIENVLLMDLFEDQKNLVHVTQHNETKSLMLVKDDSGGSITFE